MYEALKEKLFKCIEEHRDESVELLKKTINFPTTVGHEGEAQLFYAKMLEDLGMEMDIFETDLEEIKAKYDIVTSRKTFKGSPMVMAYQNEIGRAHV